MSAPTLVGPADAQSRAPLAHVVKRDGRTLPYDRGRIRHAVEMAFRAEARVPFPDPLDVALHESVDGVTNAVEDALALVALASTEGDALPIEAIQDEVERALMAAGHYAVARRFILYREARAARRQGPRIRVRDAAGRESVLEAAVLRRDIADAAEGLGGKVDAAAVADETLAGAYDGMTYLELAGASVLSARARVEKEPEYSALAARLRLREMYAEVLGQPAGFREMPKYYVARFAEYVSHGVRVDRLDERLTTFDLPLLAAAIDARRDLAFDYLGVQTIYDRYLLQHDGRRYELPQWFWMRVAMGLAIAEPSEEREERAIEFYTVLSTFSFCSSTPTLFNSGTRFPQLSSCFLTTVQDDLGDIFKAIRDNALLSKWSGGLGNDWTNVRALGSLIGGTGGPSQGVVPFLKVANDTAIAVNQGGKRQGATCAYLETWHLDIEEFIELRKNTGDDRRRTHDMHLAHWIPDLFMERVRAGAHWTLFSPSDVPDLHDMYGARFSERYEEYEAMAADGKIPSAKRVEAVGLWRRMLAMLFETGHPWLTWKDPSNIRSPQDHAGVVHSSNLCTEILLNTSRDETAVCNLGSVNLAVHVTRNGLDAKRLAITVRTALRMLDNVIEINLYPVPEARASNVKHRPVGLGIMGFQDALHKLGLSYASDAAVEFADRSMELVSYNAILASSQLARERGTYESYLGSKWSRGLLPQDTIDLLEAERGRQVPIPRGGALDWAPVRESVATHGMRNSNVMAIAPTATIANICGVSASIEPTYKNLYVKSNLSGEFTMANRYLVDDLRKLGLWDARMIEDLKYNDGALDWTPVRESVATHGMRNSNVMAIAPTATIANICGVSASIEPTYKNLYVKSNLSGEFTMANRYLVDDLRKLGLWDARMIEDLKYNDGALDGVDRIPESIREKYLTAFEIEAEWLIECAARRQKWMDMGQSLNLYLDKPSGRRLNEMYMLAWEKGLKTTYYLRTVGAGGIEQSTVDINRRGIQPRWMRSRSASSDVMVSRDAPVPSSARSAAAVVTEVIASASGATMDSALPPRATTDAMDSALSPRVTTDSAPLPRAACNLDGDCESCQ